MNKKSTDKAIVAVAWPYANGDLHLGHPAGYLLPADITNKFLRLKGTDVIMVSGSDMHGTPIAVKAWENGVDPLEYASTQHMRHVEVMQALGMEYSMYTSTATKLHKQIVQQIFIALSDKGYITKRQDELYWSEKEKKFLLDRYIEGTCPHCGYESARGDQCDNCGRTLTPEELINPYSVFGDKELIKKKSTNYYLALDKLQTLLEERYAGHPALPEWRRHVVATTKAWLAEGLEARAITRDMEGYGVALPVGYEVAGEEGKVIYVWFEAVCGYFTAAVELSEREGKQVETTKLEHKFAQQVVDSEYELEADAAFASDTYAGQSLIWADYWLDPESKSYYFMGKDNIPFHAIIWTAMLLGLNEGEVSKLNLPWNIPANQYLNLKGSKFSKSKGNVIDTRQFVEEFGLTAVRYFLISRMPENKDYSFTWEEFVDANNNELMANVGNLINRTLVFWNKSFAGNYTLTSSLATDEAVVAEVEKAFGQTSDLLGKSRYVEALQTVLELSAFGNKYFNDSEIWKVVKEDADKAFATMQSLLYLLYNLGQLLRPFLPDLGRQILSYLGAEVEAPAVGRDQWLAVNPDLRELGEIPDLKPLIQKLELEEVLAGRE